MVHYFNWDHNNDVVLSNWCNGPSRSYRLICTFKTKFPFIRLPPGVNLTHQIGASIWQMTENVLFCFTNIFAKISIYNLRWNYCPSVPVLWCICIKNCVPKKLLKFSEQKLVIQKFIKLFWPYWHRKSGDNATIDLTIFGKEVSIYQTTHF